MLGCLEHAQFKVHGLKTMTSPVTKAHSLNVDALRTLSTRNSNSPHSSLCRLHATSLASFCPGACALLQSLRCCWPDLSRHLQPTFAYLLPCRSVLVQPATSVTTVLQLIHPTGVLPWLQVILQSLCAFVQLFRRY